MVESCSGLSDSFDKVAWYYVPNSDVVDRGGDAVGGYWAPVSNRIVIAGNAEFAGGLIRHEMLHALVRQRDGHLRLYFMDRCGGVVSCNSPCASDIGAAPKPPADAVPVTSEALRIEASVIPAEPTADVDEGVFTVAVTVSNPRSYPVVLMLDPVWGQRGFFYALFRDGGSGVSEHDDIWDPSLTSFRAGESKRRYFDLTLRSLPGARLVEPATYT